MDSAIDTRVKERIITITGPFGIDEDGVPYAPAEVNSTEWWGLHQFMDSPEFTFGIEDAPRKLPSVGAIIRATITIEGLKHPNSILINRGGMGRTWTAWGGPCNGKWLAPEQIGEDWAELVVKDS